VTIPIDAPAEMIDALALQFSKVKSKPRKKKMVKRTIKN
jgi:hypothetical protein